MKKYKLLISLSAIATAGIAPVIALASCSKKEETTKSIPESMLNIESGILLGLKEGATIDAYNTLAIPADVTVIAKEAFKDAFKEDTNGSTIKTIIFNSKLSFIGENAFSGCDAITKLDLTKMQDIKIMGLKLGSDSFTTWKNSGGTAVLPDGITDMQKDWIKKLFGEAGLPGSWFGQEAGDQEKIDALNELIHSQTFNTMSEMISYIKDEADYDLEQIESTTPTHQYVWDKENNYIIQINSSDELVAGPKDYTLNPNKINLWKMVKPSTSTKLLKSAKKNSNEVYADEFSSTTPYSQYLRTDYKETWEDNKTLTFQSGLDTGNVEKLELTYTPVTEHDATPVINTMKCSLTINGSLDSIDHYGNLTELTVESLGENPENKYTEYGSVDAAIVVKKGSIATEAGSQVNEIIVDTTDTTAVKIAVADGSDIGTIGATNATVASKLTSEGIVEVETPGDVGKVEEQNPTPAPNPDPEAKFYSGNGTENAPYTIKTKQQLFNFATEVKNKAVGEKLYFNLISDIEFNGNETWTPVGTYDNPYMGIFNGCGFSIKNLKVDTPSTHKDAQSTENFTGFMGLFGFTNGDVNTDFNTESRKSIWKADEKELDKTKFAESKYKTGIKNLTLTNVNIKSTNDSTQENGAVVGRAANTYFSNVKVTNGEVIGKKAIGGIAGTVIGCIFDGCTTGTYGAIAANNLQVTATKYHVGGLTGACTYEGEMIIYDAAEAFIGCTNHAIVKQNNTGGTSGYAGGLVGICQYDGIPTEEKPTAGRGYTVFEDCLNTGSVYAEAGNAAGFSMARRAWIYNRCVNTGNISNTNSTHADGFSLAGIGYYGTALCNECHNKGNITGYSKYMAGILANAESGSLDNKGLDGCSNTGTLTPTNPDCITSTIASGQISLILKNVTFNDVNELNQSISAQRGNAISIELQNVTVTHPETGTLELPGPIGSITSNTHVADVMNITNTETSSLTVDIPNLEINVKAQCPNAYIRDYGDNSTFTIDENCSCSYAGVSGENSTVTNNGTVGGLAIGGKALEGTNNGTASYVTMGDTSCGYATGTKTFTNNGSVVNHATRNSSHVISSLSGSTCNIVINNYGTIEFKTDGLLGSGYLMCLYNSGTNVFNTYENTMFRTDDPHNCTIAIANHLTINYKPTAEFWVGGEQKQWSSLAWSKIDVNPF